MTTKQKKRVRWAEADDIFGDDVERGGKIPRLGPIDLNPTHDSTTESANQDPTTSYMASEGNFICCRYLYNYEQAPSLPPPPPPPSSMQAAVVHTFTGRLSIATNYFVGLQIILSAPR